MLPVHAAPAERAVSRCKNKIDKNRPRGLCNVRRAAGAVGFGVGAFGGFAAAEGVIYIAQNAKKVRVKPLRVILNGLGKDAAYIISRINGFTYVETEFDHYTETIKIVYEKAFSEVSIKFFGAVICRNFDERIDKILIFLHGRRKRIAMRLVIRIEERLFQ